MACSHFPHNGSSCSFCGRGSRVLVSVASLKAAVSRPVLRCLVPSLKWHLILLGIRSWSSMQGKVATPRAFCQAWKATVVPPSHLSFSSLFSASVFLISPLSSLFIGSPCSKKHGEEDGGAAGRVPDVALPIGAGGRARPTPALLFSCPPVLTRCGSLSCQARDFLKGRTCRSEQGGENGTSGRLVRCGDSNRVP